MVEAFVNDLVSALANNGGRALAEAAATAIGKLTGYCSPRPAPMARYGCGILLPGRGFSTSAGTRPQ
jgi:hypothetical protein